MKSIHISKPDETILSIIRASFPSYKGKKIKVSMNPPTRLNSYWDGGSKNSFVFVNLDSLKSLDVHSNHPFFEQERPRDLPNGLPPRIVLVEHSIFCGKDMGITIYARAEDITASLPAPIELTEKEKAVLYYSRAIKNTYGGEKNIRFKKALENGFVESWEDWISLLESLRDRGFLRKNYSITPEGMNAIGSFSANY
jgi:hypothetical protein